MNSHSDSKVGLHLEVLSGNGAGSEIFVEDELVIGRHATGAGKLADDSEISRQHARISREVTGDYAIEDLGSSNGTFVNGLQIFSPRLLALGDSIELGATALVVRAIVRERPPAPEPAAAAPDAHPGYAPTVLARTPVLDSVSPTQAPTQPSPMATAPSEPAAGAQEEEEESYVGATQVYVAPIASAPPAVSSEPPPAAAQPTAPPTALPPLAVPAPPAMPAPPVEITPPVESAPPSAEPAAPAMPAPPTALPPLAVPAPPAAPAPPPFAVASPPPALPVQPPPLAPPAEPQPAEPQPAAQTPEPAARGFADTAQSPTPQWPPSLLPPPAQAPPMEPAVPAPSPSEPAAAEEPPAHAPRLELTLEVDFDGREARIALSDGDTVTLVLQDGRWRARVGS